MTRNEVAIHWALPRSVHAAFLAVALTACRDNEAARVMGIPAFGSAQPSDASVSANRPKPDPSSATAQAFYADRFSKTPSALGMTALGRQLFFDPGLSASGKMSCATCHDPKFAYGPPNDRDTELGGPNLERVGLRAVPSLRYVQTAPPFAEHHFDEAIDESVDQGPTGGHTWDGRASSLHDQARLPLTSPLEMANESIEAVVEKVQRAAYAQQFEEIFGADVFTDRARSSTAVLLVLEVFQQNPKDFYPYSSRYDAWLRGKTELTPQEQHGLAVFNDPRKGNCASCHPSSIRHGAFPQFTDYGFVALGVPRNNQLPANRDPTFFDLGLCGPLRTDLTNHPEYCGSFRAPSLRNVSLRRVFFHNGSVHSLRDAIQFYVDRDTHSSKWYGKTPFNDLPPAARKNVEQTPPFGRKRGESAALSSVEISDMIAFLGTLTDEDATPNANRP